MRGIAMPPIVTTIMINGLSRMRTNHGDRDTAVATALASASLKRKSSAPVLSASRLASATMILTRPPVLVCVPVASLGAGRVPALVPALGAGRVPAPGAGRVPVTPRPPTGLGAGMSSGSRARPVLSSTRPAPAGTTFALPLPGIRTAVLAALLLTLLLLLPRGCSMLPLGSLPVVPGRLLSLGPFWVTISCIYNKVMQPKDQSSPFLILVNLWKTFRFLFSCVGWWVGVHLRLSLPRSRSTN